MSALLIWICTKSEKTEQRSWRFISKLLIRFLWGASAILSVSVLLYSFDPLSWIGYRIFTFLKCSCPIWHVRTIEDRLRDVQSAFVGYSANSGRFWYDSPNALWIVGFSNPVTRWSRRHWYDPAHLFALCCCFGAETSAQIQQLEAFSGRRWSKGELCHPLAPWRLIFFPLA